DANVYFCDVSNLIKGDSYVSFEGRNDIAVSLKGGLEIGGSYLVLCNRVDATSIIYMQSSPVSVIPLSETETIEEIYALVAGD
ncbi:MAG: hypothetical protein LBM28_02970, partial [Oscillospiraceae bacterium]|nr:hypothetical protein [Oscillospiraceae bacterium]